MVREKLIQFRKDTAARWAAINPILDHSEPGYEIDTGKVKIGDGATPWNSLTYLVNIGTAAGTVCAGDDSRLSNNRTPTTHATSHKSAGSDVIKIDELGAGTDVTTLNATTSAHGLLPKLSGVSTEFLNGSGNFSGVTIAGMSEADFAKLIEYLKYQYTWNREPVGYKIENASTNPAVKRIDRNGLEVTLSADFFWNHELYIMPMVLLSPAGVPTFGSDRKGTGLDLTGASGDAMVWCNNAQYKYLYESDSDTVFKWYAPYDSNYRGFDYHPHCYAGGGTKHDHFFLGVFEAGLKDDNGTIKLTSASGVQPITGGEIKYLSFTSGGTTAFTVGETLTNAVTGATGIVVSYHLTSGSWAGGDAAGVVYLRQSTGTSGAGQLNGSLAGIDCATASGASTALAFTIDDALTFSANKGAGWTIEDIYCRSLMQDLFYIQHGTRNSQTAIGLGVVNLASGSGFEGKLTGADSINDRVDAFGTGTGNGTNGQTPIRWNNFENWLGGNVLEFTAGINFYNSNGTDGDGNPYTAGSFRVTKQDGTGTIAGTLPAGSYETGVGTVPMVDGYYSKIMTDPLGGLLNIPMVAGDVNSGDNKGFCDYWYYPYNNPSIMLSGSFWYDGLRAGVGCRYSRNAPSTSYRYFGARLKYIPQA